MDLDDARRRATRRGFIGLAAFASVAMPGAARAFSVEDAPIEVDRLYRQGCSAGSEHALLRSELVDELTRHGVVAAQAQELVASLSCPLCGCPIGLALDGAAGPRQ